MGGAELESLVALAFHDVDHDDLLRAGQPRTLDRTAADATAADHHNGVARR